MKRLLCFLICILFLPAFCVGEESTAAETLVIHFLDVGQGDAALIQCGGQTLMIDGGDKNANQFIYSYLTELGLTHLDYIIATHPHDDHVKGLATALVVCDAGTVYSPVTKYDGDGFRDFTDKLTERGLGITIPHRGDTFNLGSATVIFLTEPQEFWDLNDQSLMVKIVFGNTSFLFTGDAAWDAEQDAIFSGIDLKADILKVGHHGAITSTSQAFLDAVQPKYAIISIGAGNKYGHPADETLMKFQHMYISVYRTDKHGTIICTSDGEHIGFTMSKKNRKW